MPHSAEPIAHQVRRWRERDAEREGEGERDTRCAQIERERYTERDTHESPHRALSLCFSALLLAHIHIHSHTMMLTTESLDGTPHGRRRRTRRRPWRSTGSATSPSSRYTYTHTCMHTYIHTYIHTHTIRMLIHWPAWVSLSSSVRPPILSRPSTVVRIHPTHLTPYPHLLPACLPACLRPLALTLRHLYLSNEPSLPPSDGSTWASAPTPRSSRPRSSATTSCSSTCVRTDRGCMHGCTYMVWLVAYIRVWLHACMYMVGTQPDSHDRHDPNPPTH